MGEKEGGFQFFALDRLVESKSNPRRTFGAEGIADLAASIKEKGILTPLLVRPVNGHMEIVDGARRYRAARAAGLAEIPAIVRTLDDRAVLEIQVVSNLQREDVHPLEEAAGYRALMDRFQYTAETIADKVGKSVAYVHQRMHLVKLTPELAKLFTAGSIGLAHAQLLARLQPADQARALKAGLFETEFVRGKRVQMMVTAAALRNWVEEECHLVLSGAPWKKDDAALVTKAGPCSTCPKRTGCDKLLWPDDAKGDTCTDPACYKAKLAAHIAAKERELVAGGAKVYRIKAGSEWHRDSEIKAAGVNLSKGLVLGGKDKKCPGAVKGVVVIGDGIGQVKDVCLDPVKCEIHRKAIRKDRYSDAGYSERYQPSPKEQARQREANAKERRKAAAIKLAIEQVLIKTKTLDLEDLRLIAIGYFEDVWYEFRKTIAARRGWLAEKAHAYDIGKIAAKKVAEMGEPEIHTFMLEIALTHKSSGSMGGDYPREYSPGSFAAICTRHGVNLKAIEASLAKAEKAKKDIKAIKGELARRKKVEKKA
jgi:ParB family chromosome partitioning protein